MKLQKKKIKKNIKHKNRAIKSREPNRIKKIKLNKIPKDKIEKKI
jgi:hypothetical protein